MKIRIHPSLYIYLLCVLMLSSWQTFIGAMISLFVHEAGHYCASGMVHDQIDRIDLTPFGGVMTYAGGKSPCKGIRGAFVAAAGPAANYLMLLCIGMVAEKMDIALIRSMISSCLAMILINMLPALPLDGGRLIFCLGYYVFPVAALITFLMWMGVVCGALLIGFAVYGIVSVGVINCSILIVGGYLMICAWKSRKQMILENFYTVIQETREAKHDIRSIRTYRVPLDMQLVQLIPYLGGRYDCEFMSEMDDREIRISERKLCNWILEQPLLSMQELFDRKK